MTNNQINYWTFRENQRANLARENETQRHNLASEAETGRHNVAGEQIETSKLYETSRHNKAFEYETARHNQMSERIDLSTLGETVRHNQQQESISKQANAIKREATAVDFMLGAITNSLRKAELNFAQTKEMQRIEEEKVRLEQAIRENDIREMQAAMNGLGSVSTAVFGRNGILPALGLAGIGAATGPAIASKAAAAFKGAKQFVSSKVNAAGEAVSSAASSAASKISNGSFDFFVVPKQIIDLFEALKIKPDRHGTTDYIQQ